jgi:hypothetical protein
MKVSMLVSGIVTSATLLVSGAASADYVCGVAFNPYTAGNAGNEGYTSVSLYTAANCGGTFIRTAWFCSAGATFGSCVSTAAFRNKVDDLRHLAASFHQAAINDTQVTITNATCNSGATNCAYYATFQ